LLAPNLAVFSLQKVPQFGSRRQQDALEMLKHLIDGVHEEEKKRLLARRKPDGKQDNRESKEAPLTLDFSHPELLRTLSDDGKLPAELQRTLMEQIFGGPSARAQPCLRGPAAHCCMLIGFLQARCAAP
jgi:hypothetical protein